MGQVTATWIPPQKRSQRGDICHSMSLIKCINLIAKNTAPVKKLLHKTVYKPVFFSAKMKEVKQYFNPNLHWRCFHSSQARDVYVQREIYRTNIFIFYHFSASVSPVTRPELWHGDGYLCETTINCLALQTLQKCIRGFILK